MKNPLKSITSKLSINESQINSLRPLLRQTNDFEKEIQNYTSEEILEATKKLQSKVLKILPLEKEIKVPKELSWYETEDGKKIKRELLKLVPESYALVKEVYNREVNKKHRDVQILGGVALLEGRLSEMRTGEGKTQACVLPLYLYGLAKRGAHLVTANDYLARRDGEFNGRMFNKLGLTTGVVTHIGSYKYAPLEELIKYKSDKEVGAATNLDFTQLDQMQGYFLVECTKKEAYGCDITYATNSEMGFDYLRDNMISDPREQAQRELFYCIVDEADALLIDESRTPLIISQPTQDANDLYYKFAKLVKTLDPADYVIEEKENSAFLTQTGIDKTERMLGISNLWEDYQLAHHLDNALVAEFIYKKDDKYIVKNGEIILVDEFTGRLMPGRRISNGVHEAIEAKENLPIQKESRTLATITYQNFFRLYKILAGMTGTALTESEEFHKIYKLDVLVVPTYKKIVRKDHTDIIFKTEDAKFKAVIVDIKERHAIGQPVLVGTGSVEASEKLSLMLAKEGIKHEVLNAKNHAREAEIIARAGQKNAVTISTNMAGRGTDILLGEGIAQIGGLHVIGTERHESRRIDNQLRGRSGRGGDAGSSRFYVSLSDRLMRVFGGPFVTKLLDTMKIDDDMPIESRIMGRQIETAQKRMEGNNFDIRKNLKKFDDVLNAQRDVVYNNRQKILRYFNDAISLLEDNIYKEADLNSIPLRKFILKRLYKETDLIVDQFVSSNKISKSNSTKVFEALEEVIPEKLLKQVLENHLHTTRETFLSQLKQTDKPESYKEKFKELVDAAYDIQENDFGYEVMRNIEKQIALDAYDFNWMSQLETMEDLSHSVNMRSFAQKDPVVEYKNEGFDLFVNSMTDIDSSIARRILKVSIVPNDDVMTGPSNQNQIDGPSSQRQIVAHNPTNPQKLNAIEDKMAKKKQRKENKKKIQEEKVSARIPKRFKAN